MYVYTFSSSLQLDPKSMTRTSALRASQSRMFSGLRSQWMMRLLCSRTRHARSWREKRRIKGSGKPVKLCARMSSYRLMERQGVTMQRCERK